MSLFQESQPTEDWLTKVVEAKGEQFKDVQVLAKSKIEADAYIKNLEDQLKQLREDVTKEENAKKLLEALNNKAPPATDANSSTKTSETKPDLSEDTLKALVEKTLTERELTNTAKQNTDIVARKLAETYGTEAKAEVEKRAQELGLSLSRLEQLAAESPSAFFNLLGGKQPDFSPIVRGTIRTEGVLNKTVDRDWNFYQNLRKTDKKLYYDPKTQRQLFADKQRLGSSFGN
jgi:hypothetical protein